MGAPSEKSNVVTAIVYDFETGGLDCQRCAATQISLHAVRLDTFEVLGKYNSYILPYTKKEGLTQPKKKTLKSKYEVEEGQAQLMDYEDTALKVSGITMRMLQDLGKPIEEVCDDIIAFIRQHTFNVTQANKPFMVGQNPLFDKGFMQQIMVYTGKYKDFTKVVRGSTDFWGNFQPAQLDTIILAQLALDDNKSITTWKLEATASALGVDLDDAHDADADVTATREVVRVLTSRMRSSDGGGVRLAMENKTKLRDHFKI